MARITSATLITLKYRAEQDSSSDDMIVMNYSNRS